MPEDRESRTIRLMEPLVGPLLNDEGMASTFSALILKRLHGEAELAKQQPFMVADRGKEWVVVGSHQEPGQSPGYGAWYIRVRKSDCRVDDIGHHMPMEISDEARAMLVAAQSENDEKGLPRPAKSSIEDTHDALRNVIARRLR